MQLQQLMYVIAVADHGSINKAAEALFVTQPNLSKAISNLESELNIHIFDRHNKGVTLTEQGKKLYQYALSIVDQINLIQGIAVKEQPRILTIAAYPIITMGRLLSEYYLNHSNDEILLKLLEMRMQKVVNAVENGDADVGFIMSNNVQSKELRHTLNYKNLEFTLIGTDTWYINVGPHSPLYDHEEIIMQDLLRFPVVRMPDDYFSNLTFYLEIDHVQLREFKRVIYASDSMAILTLLQTSDAFRFGPGLSSEDYHHYGIRTIPIHNCDVQIDVGWIRRKKELLSDEATEFINILENDVLKELKPFL